MLQSKLGEVDLMREIHDCLQWHISRVPLVGAELRSLPGLRFAVKRTKDMGCIEEINPPFSFVGLAWVGLLPERLGLCPACLNSM